MFYLVDGLWPSGKIGLIDPVMWDRSHSPTPRAGHREHLGSPASRCRPKRQRIRLRRFPPRRSCRIFHGGRRRRGRIVRPCSGRRAAGLATRSLMSVAAVGDLLSGPRPIFQAGTRRLWPVSRQSRLPRRSDRRGTRFRRSWRSDRSGASRREESASRQRHRKSRMNITSSLTEGEGAPARRKTRHASRSTPRNVHLPPMQKTKPKPLRPI